MQKKEGIRTNDMHKRRSFAILLLFLFAVHEGFAEYSPLSVPDSSEIRKTLINSWFTQDFEQLLTQEPQIIQNLLGEKFQVRLEDLGTEFAIVVASAADFSIEMHTDEGIVVKKTDIYPFNNLGSWILYRSKENGKPIRVCYYFQSDSEVFIQIRPDKHKSVADMALYNVYSVYGVSLGFPIEYYYTMSFAELYKQTSSILPWQYFTIEKGLYEANIQMSEVIRDYKDSISFSKDTAFDNTGLEVRISNGEPLFFDDENKLYMDSAGFAKWVVDGLVFAQTGSYLNLNPLKKETIKTKTGTMAQSVMEKYHVTFSLDWTRNLAVAWLSVISGKDTLFENSGTEVTISPFAAVKTTRGIERCDSYIKGTGYNTSTLKALMYVLAVTEPERFYLGAIRQTDGKSPEIMYYNETAVFFPFFDEQGFFHCVVYEGAQEMSIDEFASRWQGSFVNFVRLKSSSRFFPQKKQVTLANPGLFTLYE